MDTFHGPWLNVWRKSLTAITKNAVNCIEHPTKQQLYDPLPPIIKVRRTRHAGYCKRSKDRPISHILLWTPSHGWAKVGRPAKTYIQQLCADQACSLWDIPGAMDDRDGWKESVRKIRAGSASWWWWWYTRGNQKGMPFSL